MKTMPEKNIDIWVVVLAWFQQHWNAIAAFLLSVVAVIARVCYQGNESSLRRIGAECVLIGLMAATSCSIFAYLNMPEKLAYALGGIAATFGIDKIRAIALRYVDKKVGGSDEQL